MKALLAWLAQVDHPLEDVRRRGQIIISVMCAIFVIAVIALPSLIFNPKPLTSGVALGLGIILSLIVIPLARRGKVSFAGWIVVISTAFIISIPMILRGESSYTLAYLLIPVLIAGVVLRPWQIVGVLMGIWVMILVLELNYPTAQTVATRGGVLTHALLMTFIGAVISFVNSRITVGAFDAVSDGQQTIEQNARQLAELNASLEQQVNERTADLETALVKLQERATTQERLLDEIEQQREVIREMSVPVLPVAAKVLVMPLVGALDSERLSRLQENALQAVQRQSIKHLVLDITGVVVVDSQVAQGFISVVRAVRLLGAETMLVGVRPEVAQAMVSLGLELDTISTSATLQEGLQRIHNYN
ncbi:STAS domain-containing protein [Herpetosiphon giganteus]|uniref:STAS domain-containing protein n=1 Tax=Herpetosiphon giganteus TaxID=2029754 RepID=UPI00195A0CD9|nr:STAS domain-containing protein [Herpetosiphon giganteus]MBM7844214.1 rsbT co-antagonist protein RsbR [Herpetosiphon giganteus]